MSAMHTKVWTPTKAESDALLRSFHADADPGTSAAFLRALTHIVSKTYDKRYPDLKARLFIPVDSSVPAGAEFFVWRSWDYAGMAKIITDYADDLPMADVMAVEVTQKVEGLGNAYAYSINDLKAAAMSGIPLDTKRTYAVRRTHENRVDALAAFGDAASGFTGFLNNANVPIITTPDIHGGWDTATAAEILSDLNLICNSIVTTSKEAFTPDTLLLPVSRYSLLASKPYSDVVPDTVLEVFLKNSPYIRSVDQWHRLDTADSLGTGPRCVAYKRDPEMLGLVIPQEFEQLPPQPQNLAFKIPCWSKIGGVVVYYPISMVYGDGI